ncbi:MAG: ABC transporter ATP-binding protein [Rhodoferax sp.]|uniref:ABC transporter ATP-binding protein n=1 Tax=Rhodoferax sp. TaxID=50421 RepID=UPI0026056F1E|nr:ABC transporter ATP-binding protein [Rhodoferax sp.]MDD5332170.1 ABC transporter ATP-binding protein [Rhodoferax sp.]
MGHLALKGIRKSYGDAAVIHGVDLEVRDGEFLVFVGPSGCGKSTMLRMIAGLESISGGDLLIDGQRANDLRPADRGAAMVFQSYALYPHMTVAENMGFSLRMAGIRKSEREQVVARTAEVLRISHLLPRLPKALSGGERQRVAIGRAIVRKPKVFLFDEPLSNLDAALRVTMRIELSRLHKELGTTMIYVTHDQVEAMTMGDRIAVFNQGRVEQLGAPMDLYARPANEFVATFLGAPRINLIGRPAAGASAAHAALWRAAAAQAPQDSSKVGIRPEHLHLGSAEQGVPAQVMLAEHLGDASIIHLRVDGVDDLLSAKVAALEGRVTPGQTVGLSFDLDAALAFSGDGVLLGA